MGIADMSLALPEDIDADVSTIESKCDTLDRICSTMMGRAHDTDGHFHDAAGEFTSAIAWDLSSASTAELAKWEEASGSLTYGAATLRMWAEDIETYRSTREELKERWETAKSSAQFRVDNPVLSNPVDPLGGLVESWLTDQEAAEVEALEEMRAQLLGEHSTAWNTLMDQAEQTEKDLREGPSTESLERMIDAGHLGWRHIGLFPPDNPPPLTEEEGMEAADELESYLEDPEGYEGNIAEVLAMLTLVTGSGPAYQNNGGQPPTEHMDFLEAFYEGFEDTLINIDGPRGVLGAVDLLENGEGIDDEIRTGFLNSMGEGLMMLSDESLFGGYDRLPESVRRAAEGPSLMDPDQFEHYDLNTWSSEVGALETLLSSASPDMRAGVDLSATLTLSMGHYAGGGENAVDAWVGEEDTLSLVEIASRNHDAMAEIFSGEYEHPNFVGEDGEFKGNSVDESHQDVINRAIEGLYTHEWSDDGESLRSMTDWIAEESGSEAPHEVDRSEKAMVGVVETLTNLKEELSNTGHDVTDSFQGEEIEWNDVSFAHLNPEIADSLAGAFEAHVDMFADNEILTAEGKIDSDLFTGYSYSNGPIIDMEDRISFVEMVSGSPAASNRIIEAADEYTMNSLAEYLGTVGEGGNPVLTDATRSGLLWNAVGTGVAEQVTSRIEGYNAFLQEEDADQKIHEDFARDFTASFIPNPQVMETYKYIWNGVSSAIGDMGEDGSIDFPRESMPPIELNENVVRIYTTGVIHDHGGVDVPLPPAGVLNEDGSFNTNSGEWNFDSTPESQIEGGGSQDLGPNTEGQVVRDEEWEKIRNEIWPGSDTEKTVGQVSDDFYLYFEEAFNLRTGGSEEYGW